MYSTQNMSLTSWDLPGDNFDHTQMDSNWKAIDQHDHSFGKGTQITTGGIAANAITTGLIAAQAITNALLAANAVGTSNIQSQAVTNALIAPGSIYGNLIPNAAITSAMLDPTIIPLGTVTMWWRPSGSASTPGGGWEIMDGRAWSTITNSLGLSTGNIPDMRGLFAQGADINGVVAPAIGVGGGSNTVNLSHTHPVLAHSHGVPSHAHVIDSDGNHIHTWAGGLQIWSRQNAFGGGDLYTGADPDGFNYPYNNVTFQAKDGDWVTNNYMSLYVNSLTTRAPWNAGQTDGLVGMDATGSHNHGGQTEASGTLTTDGGTLSTTQSALGSTTIVPQNIALLFIMKVR